MATCRYANIYTSQAGVGGLCVRRPGRQTAGSGNGVRTVLLRQPGEQPGTTLGATGSMRSCAAPTTTGDALRPSLRLPFRCG